MMKRLLRGLALVAGLAGLLLTAGPAAAHNAYPARTYTLQVGPYQYQALLFNEKINAGDHVQVVLVPDAATRAATVQLQVAANGPGGAAVPAALIPDENDHRNTAVDVVIPAQGAWRLAVTAAGAAGRGTADFGLTVAPPAAIPPWAGWAIALSPLLGLAWFATQQRGMLRRAAAAGIQP